MRSILTAFLTVFFMTISFSQDNSYDSLWKQVEDYELQGLPKSALKILNTILEKAEAEANAPQKIKVYIFKGKFSQTLEEDAQLNIINDFKEQLHSSQYPVSNMLHSILGSLYWQYFKTNRWRFYNRTQTSEPVKKDDFRTWDLNTLFNTVSFHYDQSLKNGLQLKIDKIDQFDTILIKAPNSRKYKPTLYDFLAHRALEFYKTEENSITKPSYKFEIDDRAYLGNAKDFSQISIQSKDTSSLQLKALQLYQHLIKFHLADKNIKALIDINIKRLLFVREHATFKGKDDVLLNTLKEERLQFDEQENSGSYSFEIAKLYVDQGKAFHPLQNPEPQWKLKEAVVICDDVISKFPGSSSAKNCSSLKERIIQKKIAIRTEKFVPTQTKSRLLITYTNHNRLQIEVLPISRNQHLNLKRLVRPEEQFSLLKDLKPIYNWEARLRNEGDYQSHSTELILPELDNGYFVVLITPDPKDEKQFAFATVQSTNLAIIQKPDFNPAIFQLINRNNGSPTKKSSVKVTYTSYRDKEYSETKVTGELGEFRIRPTSRYNNASFKADYKGEVAYFDDHYVRPYHLKDEDKTRIQAFIFTDRSIYRPGQPLYFKAILLQTDGESTEVLSGKKFSIELRDVNNTEVGNLELQTNDFGSLNGSFVIPEGGLNGQFRLSISSISKKLDVRQTQYVLVEEYKRPKFQVEFLPVSESLRLNDSVKVAGEALAYSGTTVSNAKVTYRVSRQVNYPVWYYWRRPWVSSEPQEITHGETLTDESGKFNIDFVAMPDQSVEIESQPVFRFEVQADVTDINGETRSNTFIVKVGYHSVTATLDLKDKLEKKNKDHRIGIETTNLNGEFYPTSGTVSIYKLSAPDRLLRSRPWSAPDYQLIPEDEFIKQFPHDAYKDEDKQTNWQRGTQVFKSDFDTGKSRQIRLGNIKKWQSGIYLVELTAKDQLGQTVKDQFRTVVFSKTDSKPADNQLLSISTDKDSYSPGEKVRVKISSAAHTWVTADIEKNHRTILTKVLELNNDSEYIDIAVSEKDLGGFALTFSMANFNSYQSESLIINVPYPSTDLQIETQTFRDKLLPGQDEIWSFNIKGPKGDKTSAELLASMYDASLDQFKTHDWNFNPFPKRRYYPYGIRNGHRSFGTLDFRINQKPITYSTFHFQRFDRLNWFGFNMFNPGNYDQYLYNLRRSRNISKTGNISGVVSDASGPLPGVNVLIKGSTNGTQTDFDGRYWVNARPGDVLVFSYVGFVTKEIKISSSTVISLILEEDSAMLEEVVVTAQGISRERGAVAYAVSDVESEDDMLMKSEMASTQQPEESKVTAESFSGVQARTNFRETAFFYPDLRTNENGDVSFEFTAPEALTQWKLQLLAHNQEGEYATQNLKAVTQKDLMVLPNPPRFLRENDQITLSSKIANLTDKSISGDVILQLFDAFTEQPVDIAFSNTNGIKSFVLNGKGNTEVSWELKVPETVQALKYKILAKSGPFSDGEQAVLPVLSNRMLVTETLPMWIGSNETKAFVLEKLVQSTSESLKHQNLSLEMTSNPAWYAVQALPYLMEFPHECNEQLFSRYFANTLATHIINSHPRIKDVFDQWRNSETLLSNLEKNPELKSILINETPWLREAQSEGEQRKRLGLLFDLNKMSSELKSAFLKLKRNQLPNGAWSWFKGGRENRYITQHMLNGFGHLKHLNVEHSSHKRMIDQGLQYLDAEFIRTFHDIRKYDKDIDLSKDYLTFIQLHYLYMRSFFKDSEISVEHQKIMDYYLDQIEEYWLSKSLYAKGLMALIMHRYNRPDTAKMILESLKETSINSEELGMYWKENSNSWYWYKSSIETQALMIEAFSELGADNAIIDELKVWLLRNKQTNKWSTTKATTEAVYALLLQGSDWLMNSKLVQIKVGEKEIDPNALENVTIEAGTGYFKTSWSGPEIKSEMGNIILKKDGEGIAWGGLYWQYFEDLDKIESAATPLQLEKKLFLKTNTEIGEQLTEIEETTGINVGDLITVRIVLQSDRNMEFLHMKDMRASGLEPVNVISQYKWQDGLGYYESTKDASTNFFIDLLPKGVYVFEYDLRANNKGNFSNGITSIQSMYAPEFSSHSEGARIQIKR